MTMHNKLMMMIAAATLAVACGPEQVVETGVTGVTLTVVSGAAIDQVSIVGEVDGRPPFDEVRTPQPPRSFSNSDETVVILVDEELSGQLLTLTVEGWFEGQLVAGGTTEVELERQQLVSATVRLDCRGDACEDCGPESCPTGCCTAGGCLVPSVEHCGTEGEACLACDPRWTDRCVEGECRCGNGLACEPGQRCAGGQCVCDGESCPAGCCDGQQCLLRSFEACGVAGTTCVACDPELANSCSGDGECRCGNGPPCALGQNCLSGICVCDTFSCDGCCEGDTCQTPSVESCGSGGATCTPCPEEVADQCSPEGVCQCGEGPMAGPGQRCVDGERICDELSCPAGCCISNTCEAPTLETCGTDGEACSSCPLLGSSRCVEGECRCGAEAPCEANQRCVGGECVCDGESCDGCCDGTSCLPGTDPLACGARGNACMACPDGDECLLGICSSCTPSECPSGCCLGSLCVEATSAEACGTAGEVCQDCGDRADRCSSGACRCGTSPPCEAGQVCVDGECLCDAVSCPHGCCDGGACQTDLSVEACGSGGEVCQSCSPELADDCSPEGSCRCGSGPACQPGQQCESGTCVCNAESCPGGCCAGSTCESPTLLTCGFDGALCQSCSATRSDRCSDDGQCRCGSGPACEIGQRCVEGVCRCDSTSCAGCCDGDTCRSGTTNEYCGSAATACETCPRGEVCEGGACSGCNISSCPDGCCSGSGCVSPPTLASCGTAGAACLSCDPIAADRCVNGLCRCGSGAPCSEGLECLDGACRCGPRACPEGCCDGEVCAPHSLERCGVAGEACVSCNPLRSDTCNSEGECRCGAEPQCAAGQECVSGACLCTTGSCSGCCNHGVCEPGTDNTACGIDGETCQRCHPVREVCRDGVCATL